MISRTSARLAPLLTGLAFASLFMNLPARADDEARKIGSSYVINYGHLDLNQPADRAALLEQIEQSATHLCEREQVKESRDACTDKAIASSIKASPGKVRRAVKTARLERDVEQQALR